MLNRNTGIKYWQSKLFLKNWMKNSSIFGKRSKNGRKKKTSYRYHVMLNMITMMGNCWVRLPLQKMMKNTVKLNKKLILSLSVSTTNNKKSVSPKSQPKALFILYLKMKIRHSQFCSSCICLRIIKFFLIWCFWPNKCFYQDLTLSLSLELGKPLPKKISTWKKKSKLVTQKQFGEVTILNLEEPIWNQLLTQKLFLVHLVK